MKSLVQLRMMQHQKVMRQMVAEIHRGKLNIDQAAAKCETTRKTVQQWIDIVEEESERPGQAKVGEIIRPTSPKKNGRFQPAQTDSEQTQELKAQIQTLEQELEEANRDGGPFQSSLLLHFSASRRAGIGRRFGKKVRYQNVGPQPIRVMLMNHGTGHPASSTYSAVRRMSASAVRLVLADRRTINIGNGAHHRESTSRRM